jgi:amino-acid N-acetyltransferase
MQIEEALKYRENITNLLAAEKLPTVDLPLTLENFRVAKETGTIIGVVGIEIYSNYGLLRSLVVLPTFRGRGVANYLLENIERFAASKSLREIYLLTETAPDYFSRRGYIKITRADVPEAVQQSSEFSHVCPQSAIVMKKSLNLI